MRRLRGAGLELDWRGPCSYRYHPLVVHGLLRLVPGTCYSVLAPWGCELGLLWEYYQRPLDAFSLTVAGRFTCVEPQDLCVFQRRGRAGGHASAGLGEAPAARLGSNGVAWPADDLVTDCFLKGPGSLVVKAEEALRMLGVENPKDVPVLFLPEPVGLLLLKGNWSEVLCLARWHQLRPDWPPAEFTSHAQGRHAPVTCESISVPKLQQLVSDLRRWAPHIHAGALHNLLCLCLQTLLLHESTCQMHGFPRPAHCINLVGRGPTDLSL